jgi:hypothetical protein
MFYGVFTGGRVYPCTCQACPCGNTLLVFFRGRSRQAMHLRQAGNGQLYLTTNR